MLDRHRAEREGIRAALTANRARRERAAAELEGARDELGELLAAGGQVSLSVAEMASRAGVRRDSAYGYLRRVGATPRRELRRLAEQAGIPPGPRRRAWLDEREEERKRASAADTAPPRPGPAGGPDGAER